jgi:hypothetical protein
MTDKLKIRVEYHDDGLLKQVRPHRAFYGRFAVADPLLMEVEWEENEELYGALVPESEGLLGRAARPKEQPLLVLTPDPGLYGTDADRVANGQMAFKKLAFGEWNILNREELGF